LGGDFEGVVGGAAVAAGVAGDEGEGIVIGGEVEGAEAAFSIRKSAVEELGDVLFAERLEDIDAAAGEQGGDDFKGGIFSGGADEADGAALDVGEERILLGLVEAVDFVDEEDGAGVHLGGLRRGCHYLLDLFDTAHDGGEFHKICLCGFGDDFGEGGLAGAGRTPEDHGTGA